jgi:predicted AAA+ superfamily ATPase
MYNIEMQQKEVKRQYLQQLMQYKHQDLIKVLSGMRRSGKSTIFKQFQQHLIDRGISDHQIISLNFENLQNEHLLDYQSLNQHIIEQVKDPDKWYYVFLDEIQMVEQFEKVVNSLHLQKNIDLYITGSNAYFLSGEFATYLSGRYVQIDVFPLSLKEFSEAYSKLHKSDLYAKYIEQGAMPYLINSKNNFTTINQYLDGIYNTVLIKDIVARKGISEISTLESVTKFLADNIGSINSVKKISDTLTSYGRKTSPHTVENYLSGLTDALLF